jgi:hypothetical protein
VVFSLSACFLVWCGRSDPFVRVSSRLATKCTSTVKRSLNPTWGLTEGTTSTGNNGNGSGGSIGQHNGAAAGSAGQGVGETFHLPLSDPSAVLHVEVFDEDAASHEFIGQWCMTLKWLLMDPAYCKHSPSRGEFTVVPDGDGYNEVTGWFPLLDKKFKCLGEPGEVRLQLKWYHREGGEEDWAAEDNPVPPASARGALPDHAKKGRGACKQRAAWKDRLPPSARHCRRLSPLQQLTANSAETAMRMGDTDAVLHMLRCFPLLIDARRVTIRRVNFFLGDLFKGARYSGGRRRAGSAGGGGSRRRANSAGSGCNSADSGYSSGSGSGSDSGSIYSGSDDSAESDDGGGGGGVDDHNCMSGLDPVHSTAANKNAVYIECLEVMGHLLPKKPPKLGTPQHGVTLWGFLEGFARGAAPQLASRGGAITKASRLIASGYVQSYR